MSGTREKAVELYDSKVFRQTMGCFATGVTLVTVRDGEELRCITANSFTSVSLEPPLVLVCLDNRTSTSHLIQKAGRFAVNILSQGQQEVSNRFAGKWDMRNGHPLDDLQWEPAPVSGAPLLAGAIGHVDCTLERTVEAGDHTIFIGRVHGVDCSNTEAEPLMYYRGKYSRVAYGA